MNPILRSVPVEILTSLSKRDLITLVLGEQQIREQLLNLVQCLKEELLYIEGKFVVLKKGIFTPSSEKSQAPDTEESVEPDKPEKEKKGRKGADGKGPTKKPSERYPNLPQIEHVLELSEVPQCSCCSATMLPTEMFETSEYLNVIPKKYQIIIQKRRKYRCGKCHSSMITTPGVPRIKPGSSYGDDLIIDAALSKYCDLLPMERYCAIAGRNGLKNLPPQSLIEATHNLADFLTPVVELIKTEVFSSKVLLADETTHRMLEGDETTKWYLWGFSGEKASYFECHGTRSGDIASALLINSQCEILVSDVFSGYAKAVRDANTEREKIGLQSIRNAYCNAHARRKFKDAEVKIKNDASDFINFYRQIYKLEATIRNRDGEGTPPDILKIRSEMEPLFAEMKTRAEALLPSVSLKSRLAIAINYFLKNFAFLTLFLTRADIPIDNNAQERRLRNPVIGRKTWYGTHSVRGAETAAKLFTLIETCRLNNVNPRVYFPAIVRAIHDGQASFTPSAFAEKNPQLN